MLGVIQTGIEKYPIECWGSDRGDKEYNPDQDKGNEPSSGGGRYDYHNDERHEDYYPEAHGPGNDGNDYGRHNQDDTYGGWG